MVKQNGGDTNSMLPKGVPLGTGTSEIGAGLLNQAGGRRRRRHSSKHHKKSSKRRHHRRKSAKKGGDGGIIATAAVPFGLLALQRYFKGSKTAKKDVRKIGSSVKRTFRRRL
jgi:hypothetical protein